MLWVRPSASSQWRVSWTTRSPASMAAIWRSISYSIVRTLDSDTRAVELEPSVAQDRRFVLTDLIVLRHVRIEVVLAGEDRAFRNFEVQGSREAERELHRLLVEHGQRAGETETRGAYVRVRLRAELVRAATEQLRHRGELAMDLEPDHDFHISLAP